MWLFAIALFAVIGGAVGTGAYLILDRRIWALEQKIEKLQSSIDRTSGAVLSERLDDIERALEQWRSSVTSNFGKLWQKLAAPREPGPPKKLDRDALRREHLPKVQL